MNDIEQIIEDRIKVDRGMFFRRPVIVQELNSFCICMRNKLFGFCLRDAINTLTTNCIFDEIIPFEDNIFITRINQLYGIYDINQNAWNCSPSFTSFRINENYFSIELKNNNQVGLYDCRHNKLVIPIKYDAVTCSCNGDYLWVKQNNEYHFVKNSTRELISLYETKMAYDTEHGMFAVDKYGYVNLFTEDGLQSKNEFRKILIKNQGRLKLQNLKFHLIHYVDIYGNILN